MPEQVGVGHWNRDEVAPADRYAQALTRGGVPRALLSPAAEAQLPEAQSLKDGGLAGVVGAGEDNDLGEVDVGLLKPPEVADAEPGEHRGLPPPRVWVPRSLYPFSPVI